jgi:hypothetical protein
MPKNKWTMEDLRKVVSGEWATEELLESLNNYDPDAEEEDEGLTAEQCEAIADLLRQQDAGSLGALFKRWENK